MKDTSATLAMGPNFPVPPFISNEEHRTFWQLGLPRAAGAHPRSALTGPVAPGAAHCDRRLGPITSCSWGHGGMGPACSPSPT